MIEITPESLESLVTEFLDVHQFRYMRYLSEGGRLRCIGASCTHVAVRNVLQYVLQCVLQLMLQCCCSACHGMHPGAVNYDASPGTVRTDTVALLLPYVATGCSVLQCVALMLQPSASRCNTRKLLVLSARATTAAERGRFRICTYASRSRTRGLMRCWRL